MKNTLNNMTSTIALIMVIMLSWVGSALGDDSDEVKALVEKGVIMAVIEGEDSTVKAINDPKGPFVKGDIYLFAGKLDRMTLAGHPFSPNLIGKDSSTLRDNQGNFIIFEFVKTVLENGAGWTEYWWPKPKEKTASLKQTYVMKVPGQNLYIGAGFYPN